MTPLSGWGSTQAPCAAGRGAGSPWGANPGSGDVWAPCAHHQLLLPTDLLLLGCLPSPARTHDKGSHLGIKDLYSCGLAPGKICPSICARSFSCLLFSFLPPFICHSCLEYKLCRARAHQRRGPGAAPALVEASGHSKEQILDDERFISLQISPPSALPSCRQGEHLVKEALGAGSRWDSLTCG